MKTVTQKDFQNLYKSPEYEQTEEMRRTLARLPEKKKTDWGTVFGKRRVAIILVAVLALLGVAGMAVSYFTGISVSWDAKPTEYVEPENHLTTEEYQFDVTSGTPVEFNDVIQGTYVLTELTEEAQIGGYELQSVTVNGQTADDSVDGAISAEIKVEGTNGTAQ